MAELVRIPLRAEQFGRHEELLAESGVLSATAFRFSTGVAAVCLRTDVGETVILPFQGQHVWSMHMGGRDLGWKSPVKEPCPNSDFLHSFGGIVQHCGLLAVGGPGPGDSHGLHGELPNAPFQDAWLLAGSDEQGDWLGIGGEYRNAVAFGRRYAVRTLLKLHVGQTTARVEVEATNLSITALPLFYMAHINFRPVDGGRIVYSAPRDRAHVRPRTVLPAHITPKAELVELMERLERDPLSHETLVAGQPYDPEAVFFIDYTPDGEGYGHTLQVHPDGSADYVRHRPAELPYVTRWISRTPDQDSIAIAEIGSAEPLGYTAAMERGMAVMLPGGKSWRCAWDFGMLPAEQAAPLVARVDAARG